MCRPFQSGGSFFQSWEVWNYFVSDFLPSVFLFFLEGKRSFDVRLFLWFSFFFPLQFPSYFCAFFSPLFSLPKTFLWLYFLIYWVFLYLLSSFNYCVLLWGYAWGCVCVCIFKSSSGIVCFLQAAFFCFHLVVSPLDVFLKYLVIFCLLLTFKVGYSRADEQFCMFGQGSLSMVFVVKVICLGRVGNTHVGIFTSALWGLSCQDL